MDAKGGTLLRGCTGAMGWKMNKFGSGTEKPGFVMAVSWDRDAVAVGWALEGFELGKRISLR